MKRKILMTLSLLAGIAAGARAQQTAVTAREGTLELPTYVLNAAETAPIFERDWSYQRARRSVYPYALDDNMTRDKKTVSYKALYLENEYVELCVLPEIGGRLFYAIDKTNGYDICYHQHVVKPANVGMTGAWISGGVEWNVFHHHRATSQYPIDYKLVDNGDGSKTIWVGEVEKRHRMSWAIGMTLYPDRSYIEVKGRFFNNSPDRNSMLHWNNVATHANENYQIVFPENTEFGTFHHKNSFMRWPVPDAPYCGNPDYIGKDVSYWRNLPALMGGSVFVYDLQDDFIGGYDYGKNAGTMLAGNRHINKGGKFWTWGHMNYGHEWDCKTLTDEDGAYVELMTAAYSDNQPDYCWLNPYETKEFTAYWYGIRDLKHVNRGNEHATVNMEVGADGQLHLAANVTRIRPDARIVVRRGGKTLYETTALIAPDKPFAADTKVPAEEVAEPSEVTMYLYDSEGNELISYHPYKLDRTKPMPDPVVPLNPDPKSVENTEEVYYLGMRNLQFHNAHVDPNDYFFEVVRRDPGDVRANTQLGIHYRKQGDFARAKKHLRTALKRQTANQTRVSDGESMYNLGLILKAEGRYADAVDTLYRAAWDYEYASAAYFQLAQISSLTGDSGRALQEAQMAVAYNGMNLDARNLLTTLLRRSGRQEEAARIAADVVAFDPLNYYATYELVRMGKLPEETFARLLRGVSESYLELALYYMNNGFGDETDDILARSESIAPYPTVEYYQAWRADARGDRAAAGKLFAKAEAGSTDYVYPFRLETVAVYEKALEYMPGSANTWYYLGNLYFQKQPARAMECWKKAVELRPDFAMALRNLGWGSFFFAGDCPAAAEWYRKAIEADREGNAIFLAECDEILERMNAPLQTRYELFAGREALYEKRYDSETKAIKQRILHGEYEEVLRPLLTRFYSRREHIEDLHDIYVDACLLSGLKARKNGDDRKALEYMLMMNEYPENHGYAHLEYYARDAQVYYNIGLAYERVGDRRNARKYFKMASQVEVRDADGIYNYEKALAMKKIDPKAPVGDMLRKIVETGEAGVPDYVQRFFESFGYGEYPEDVNARAYYMQGIGHKALGDESRAAECFRKALEQRNDHLWANYYLGMIR